MALFGKLFEKKECAICGGEIGCWATESWRTGTAARTVRQSSPLV